MHLNEAAEGWSCWTVNKLQADKLLTSEAVSFSFAVFLCPILIRVHAPKTKEQRKIEYRLIFIVCALQKFNWRLRASLEEQSSFYSLTKKSFCAAVSCVDGLFL